MPFVENLKEYDSSDIYRNCLVITLPGQSGFIWWVPNGKLYSTLENMEVRCADVQVLHNSKTGESSAGWIPR